MLQAFNSNKQARNKTYAVVHFLWKNQKLNTNLILEGKIAWIYQMEFCLESRNESVGELSLNPFLNVLALSFKLGASEYHVVIFCTCFIL